MIGGKNSPCSFLFCVHPNVMHNLLCIILHSGSDAECEFSDVNPIGQTDEHDITHAVVEVCCWFVLPLCFMLYMIL